MTGPVPPAVSPPPAGTAGTSAGTTGTVTAAAPEPAGEASLEKLPEKLKELLRTIVVSGTVIEQSGDGNVKVRTQAGEVSLKTPTPLPQDRQVTLQIPPGNPPLKALVFMVAPLQTPQQVAVPAPPLATGAPAPTAVPRAPAPVPVAVGTVIAATVASTSPPPAPPAAPAPVASAPVPAPPAPPAPLNQTPLPATPQPAPPQPATPPQPAPAAPATASPASAPPPATPGPSDAPAPPAPAQQQPQQVKAPPSPAVLPPQAAPPQMTPATAVPTSAAAPSPPLPQASAPVPTPAQAQPTAQQMPALKAGTTVEVRIMALPQQQNAAPAPPPSQASQPPAPSPAPAASSPSSASTLPTLAATVAGTTSAGQPIVTTERGVMVLNTKVPLPHGTEVTIGLPPIRPVPAEPFDPLRGQDWPALRETLEVLAKADPAGARALANAILPQPNARLAATLLAFTGGVKKGDARAWLGGEAAKTLESLGRADLLEKLEEDFKQLARQAADVPPGDWKPYSIPFSDGTELHRILMHVRQPGAEEVDEDAGGGDGHGSRANRFLIDLTLSRIGELQLDGLIRPRRFDLILRTHMPLPPEMRQEIGKLFNGSLETLGMTGAVSFQAGTQGWVAVQPGPSGRVGMSA